MFRPIGFLPFVKATLIIHDRAEIDFPAIFEQFDRINFELDSKPWHYVAWNPTTKRMIMRSDTTIMFLLIYIYDRDLLEARELDALAKGYSSKIAYEGKDAEAKLRQDIESHAQ